MSRDDLRIDQAFEETQRKAIFFRIYGTFRGATLRPDRRFPAENIAHGATVGTGAALLGVRIMAPEPQTVLVVDDVPLERFLLVEYLRERGFDALPAASGEEAISTLKSGQPVDIVLSDVHLDGKLDGFALARWVRDHRPAVRTVLGTSRGGMAREAAAICAGAESPG
jgi:CheY-like chemotaxis protein